MRLLPLLLVLASTVAPISAPAQWTMQESHTTASLRGIHNVGNGVAWASGTGGTVLRTIDEGTTWQTCPVPPGADKLDFRGVQAFDADTAIVMSSGKGDLSRLYKTSDGCKSWKLVFSNPDPNGFWDAVVAQATEASSDGICGPGSKVVVGTILGDPAIHKSNQWDTSTIRSFYLANFVIGITCPKEELSPSASSIFASTTEAAFAASNSVLKRLGNSTYWIASGTRLIQYNNGFSTPGHYAVQSFCNMAFPVSRRSASSGAFSIDIRPDSIELSKAIKFLAGSSRKAPFCQKADMVVVGGDYMAVDDRQGTAAFTAGTNKFEPSETPPHGYRSAVAYSPKHKAWITVGPNGTDLSTDDGRNWRALKPGEDDAEGADRDWNALSLPFVVGPKGRIGKLNPTALTGLSKP